MTLRFCFAVGRYFNLIFLFFFTIIIFLLLILEIKLWKRLKYVKFLCLALLLCGPSSRLWVQGSRAVGRRAGAVQGWGWLVVSSPQENTGGCKAAVPPSQGRGQPVAHSVCWSSSGSCRCQLPRGNFSPPRERSPVLGRCQLSGCVPSRSVGQVIPRS